MSLEQPLVEQPSSESRVLPAWLVLFVVSGVAYTSNAIISLLLPFTPKHLEGLHVSQDWCGLIFAAFPLAMLVCSPLAVKAMGRFGRVSVLFVGLMLQGVATVIFGYADALSGGYGANVQAALAILLVSRLVCGLGGACANNAIFSIAADRFPDSLGAVMGLNEVVIGLGFTTGPPIGEALFLLRGFALPFLVAGLTIIIFAPTALLLSQPPRPKTAQQKLAEAEGQVSLLAVLTPAVVVPGLTLLLGTSVFGVVESILSLYLDEQVGCSDVMTSVIFAIFAAAYSLAGPVVGIIADRKGPLTICAWGGLCAGLVMVLLLGPEAHRFPRGTVARQTYEIVALVLLGLGQAATVIPSLPAMKDGAPTNVNASSEAVTEAVVAWFNMFLQLGLAVSPPLATHLADSMGLGFEWTVLICGSVVAAYGAFAVFFAASRKRTSDQLRNMMDRTMSPSSMLGSPGRGTRACISYRTP